MASSNCTNDELANLIIMRSNCEPDNWDTRAQMALLEGYAKYAEEAKSVDIFEQVSAYLKTMTFSGELYTPTLCKEKFNKMYAAYTYLKGFPVSLACREQWYFYKVFERITHKTCVCPFRKWARRDCTTGGGGARQEKPLSPIGVKDIAEKQTLIKCIIDTCSGSSTSDSLEALWKKVARAMQGYTGQNKPSKTYHDEFHGLLSWYRYLLKKAPNLEVARRMWPLFDDFARIDLRPFCASVEVDVLDIKRRLIFNGDSAGYSQPSEASVSLELPKPIRKTSIQGLEELVVNGVHGDSNDTLTKCIKEMDPEEFDLNCRISDTTNDGQGEWITAGKKTKAKFKEQPEKTKVKLFYKKTKENGKSALDSLRVVNVQRHTLLADCVFAHLEEFKNPTVSEETTWDRVRTEATMAGYDCHRRTRIKDGFRGLAGTYAKVLSHVNDFESGKLAWPLFEKFHCQDLSPFLSETKWTLVVEDRKRLLKATVAQAAPEAKVARPSSSRGQNGLGGFHSDSHAYFRTTIYQPQTSDMSAMQSSANSLKDFYDFSMPSTSHSFAGDHVLNTPPLLPSFAPILHAASANQPNSCVPLAAPQTNPVGRKLNLIQANFALMRILWSHAEEFSFARAMNLGDEVVGKLWNTVSDEWITAIKPRNRLDGQYVRTVFLDLVSQYLSVLEMYSDVKAARAIFPLFDEFHTPSLELLLDKVWAEFVADARKKFDKAAFVPEEYKLFK